ncbi:cysteine methyltransferase [Lewinellaceae bacterium SD302]|nr:cysteine methyltransferase [Lewinellaceae bacterium SD302]
MDHHYQETSFGIFKFGASPTGLSMLNYVDDSAVPKGALQKKTTNKIILKAVRQLEEYFAGKRQDFDLPLDFSEATDYYRKVWQELINIPYGRTTSYQFIAEKLGDKNAIRAVGQANRRNPIAIVVPCHRVIAKNGDLQGYFYGLDFKRKLLALENPKSFGEQGALF